MLHRFWRYPAGVYAVGEPIPIGTPVWDQSDRLLYGTVYYGGPSLYEAGAIYSVNPATRRFKIEHASDGFEGGYPVAPLVLDAAHGVFYDTTTSGGTTGYGTIVRFNPKSHKLTALYSFTSSNLDYAWGLGPALLLNSTGTLRYGTATYGGNLQCGSNCAGTVFKFDTVQHKFSLVARFQPASPTATTKGANPSSGLLFDGSGSILYGVTDDGGKPGCVNGSYGCGAVYSVTT